jgi:catechol 2,3-dioxygenase-like lactoylglutathione lyase family enzyme
MVRRLLLTVGLTLTASAVGAQTAAQATTPYDHLHLAASDPDAAYNWYVAHLGGTAGENPGRVIFEPYAGHRPLPVQLIFIKSADARPSLGGVIESLGLSVADVRATVATLQTAGATVVEAPRDVAGLWTRAVVTDPWGTTLELVQDASRPGFHHVTLRVPDPEATLRWLQEMFGGERTTMRGQVEALRYDSTYIVALKGAGAPSQGRAIDHLGFMPRSLDATASTLTGHGVAFTQAPSPKANAFGHRIAYIEAPGGLRIELVEHTTCAWGSTP